MHRQVPNVRSKYNSFLSVPLFVWKEIGSPEEFISHSSFA